MPAWPGPGRPVDWRTEFPGSRACACWNDISPRLSAALVVRQRQDGARRQVASVRVSRSPPPTVPSRRPTPRRPVVDHRRWRSRRKTSSGPLSIAVSGRCSSRRATRTRRSFATIVHSIGVLRHPARGVAAHRGWLHVFPHDLARSASRRTWPTRRELRPLLVRAPLNPDLPDGGYLVDGLLNISEAKFGLQDNVVKLAISASRKRSTTASTSASVRDCRAGLSSAAASTPVARGAL